MTWILVASSIFFAASSSAQTVVGSSIPIAQQLAVIKAQQDIGTLMSGRPVITGIPNYQNGIQFSNTSGSALTFQDGTTQNTSITSTSFTWVTIATATFFSGTSYSFAAGDLISGTVITSSAEYRLSWDVSAVAIGAPQLTINNDGGGNYYSGNSGNTQAAAAVTYGTAGGAFFPLTINSASPNIQAGQGAGGILYLKTQVSFPNNVFMHGTMGGVLNGASTVIASGQTGGYYIGSANVSSIQFKCTAACSAQLKLEKYLNTW